MTDQLTPAEGITVTHYRGQSDGVPVVQIDTAQDAGWLRVKGCSPPSEIRVIGAR